MTLLLSWLVFFLINLNYPLHGQLSGDYDAWGNLAMFKMLENWVAGIFSSEVTSYSFMYPEIGAWKGYGADFGSGVFFVFFRFLGFQDLWSYWLGFTLILAINFTALVYFFETLNFRWLLAVSGAIIFSLSGFTTGNYDHINIITLFPFLFSIACFLRFKESNGIHYLYWSGMLLSLQLYLSPYAFLLTNLSLFALLLGNLSKVRQAFRGRLIHLSVLLGILIICMVPFFSIYVFSDLMKDWINPINADNIYFWSMNPGMISWLPYTGFYSFFQGSMDHMPFISLHQYHIGFTILGFSIMGLYHFGRKQSGILLMLIFGVIFALGPTIHLSSALSFPNITRPLYDLFDLYDFIRIPLRFFFMVQLALIVFALTYIRMIGERDLKKANFLLFAFLLCFIAENHSFFKAGKFNYDIFAKHHEMTAARNGGVFEPGMVALHLPTNQANVELRYGMRREYQYMYLQSAHHANICNGATAFIPDSRFDLDIAVYDPDKSNLMSLIRNLNIERLIIHRDMLICDEEVTSILWAENNLELIWSSDDIEVFSTSNASEIEQ